MLLSHVTIHCHSLQHVYARTRAFECSVFIFRTRELLVPSSPPPNPFPPLPLFLIQARKKAAPAKKTPAKGGGKKKTPAKKKASATKGAAKRKTSSGGGGDADSDSDSDDEPLVKSKKPKAKKAKVGTKAKKAGAAKAGAAAKKPKKEKEPEEPLVKPKWMDMEPLADGKKWISLSHHGVLFPPPYAPLVPTVHMLYDGEPYPLAPAAEEVALFYASMMKREYVKHKVFNKNFMTDWKGQMTAAEKAKITDLTKCDFSKMSAYLDANSEARKARPKEEKEIEKVEKAKLKEKYGFAVIDGERCAIGNYNVEPPGLFQGRGEHPKMGKLKARLRPEDVTINVSDRANAPAPPPGTRWKEVVQKDDVTWLAAWTENIAGNSKYVMLAADSPLKQRADLEKYEKARRLKELAPTIREKYTEMLKSTQMVDRQKSTALYFIDKLALRAGGEKDTEEEADTVGCCNLRYEHVFCEQSEDGETKFIRFDFPGKDSIRYENTVEVIPQVWKNIRIFKKEPKGPGDELFDRLKVPELNRYLQEFMPGLTAKVWRTYNASVTLQEQLKTTPVDGTVEDKFLAYQRANRAVAVLCNHQRGASKQHGAQVEKMDEAITDIKKQLKESRKKLKEEKKGDKNAKKIEQLKKKIAGLEVREKKKEIAKVDKEENKTIALSTSKLNYLDPRISAQWCKMHKVPRNKVYNKTQQTKFKWAIAFIHFETEIWEF